MGETLRVRMILGSPRGRVAPPRGTIVLHFTSLYYYGTGSLMTGFGRLVIIKKDEGRGEDDRGSDAAVPYTTTLLSNIMQKDWAAAGENYETFGQPLGYTAAI